MKPIMPDNVVTLAGNMTRDPELRFTTGGQAVCNFGIATTRVWTDRNTQERKEATGFFDVIVWGPSAENAAQSFRKGDRVVISGSLDYRTWETDSGDKRSKVEIKAEEVAASTRWATVSITRNEKRSATQRPADSAAPAAAWGADEDF